jgi:hypothetical protein
MAAFDERWMERWQDLVNEDRVTKVLGRHFDADVLFEFGNRSYVVSYAHGTVTHLAETIGPETTWHFALRGPIESWSNFVQPVPPPMYNDIWAMAHPLHGRLKIEGDVKVMWQNLRAFTWTLDLMRNVRE